MSEEDSRERSAQMLVQYSALPVRVIRVHVGSDQFLLSDQNLMRRRVSRDQLPEEAVHYCRVTYKCV